MSTYLPADLSRWQGRRDGLGAERLHEVVQGLDPRSVQLPAHSIVLTGLASDIGIRRNAGRPGAAEGPEAFRRALAGYPAHALQQRPLIDGGDIVCTSQNLENAQAAFTALSAAVLRQGAFSLAIGGGHEIAWAHFCALAAAGYANDLGIINIDAHYDMRALLPGGQGSSGTSFTQIAAYQCERNLPLRYLALGIQEDSNTPALHATARTLGCQVITAEKLHSEGYAAALPTLETFLRESRYIYLTICLDVFAAAYAPGVSAPQPLGLTPWQVVPLLQHIAHTGKLLACDIAELSPPLDHDGLTARLAAALAIKILNKLE